MSNTIEITPLSEFKGNLHEFVAGLSYASDGGRVSPEQQRRWLGDHHLLGLLAEAIRLHPRPGWERPPTVGELPESVIRQAVEEVERLRCGEWRLHSDVTPGRHARSLSERLDAHFWPLQKAGAERQRAAREDQERRARISEEAAAAAAARGGDSYRRVWGLPA